uniref:Uncharacterized protein n=1 Tax=Kalanchoe fedtschenkoi TaxID=63787 RepID=A0A7N0ZQI7_KALFE
MRYFPASEPTLSSNPQLSVLLTPSKICSLATKQQFLVTKAFNCIIHSPVHTC